MGAFLLIALSLVLLSTILAYQGAHAVTDCVFSIEDNVMTVEEDCTTDSTIMIPDGFTLDGNGHTITAVDPVSGHFLGAVIKNAGTTAQVRDVVITTDSLANVCDGSAPDTRLRGILFEGASGSITGNSVLGINQGASGCQEGNAIEVRNAPFDGTHPNTLTVEIAHNTINDFQKTGILANGDVVADIHHNKISASATQANLAANSIQIGFGATGSITHNDIGGNQWCGPSEFVATAILIFDADGVTVRQNNIGSNSDVGIYGFADNLMIDNNKVFEDKKIADCNSFGYDIGVGNYGSDNTVTNNKVRGFDTPYDGVEGGKNKVIPSPNSS